MSEWLTAFENVAENLFTRNVGYGNDSHRKLLACWLTICFSSISDELGDYEREVHTENYVSSLKLALRQSLELEKKVIELHRKREPGQDVVTIYDEFIIIARSLETYGIDPHPVKDFRGTQLYVGKRWSRLNYNLIHELIAQLFSQASTSQASARCRLANEFNIFGGPKYPKSISKAKCSSSTWRTQSTGRWRNIQWASSARRAWRVATFGDVPSSKCCFLRKFWNQKIKEFFYYENFWFVFIYLGTNAV